MYDRSSMHEDSDLRAKRTVQVVNGMSIETHLVEKICTGTGMKLGILFESYSAR